MKRTINFGKIDYQGTGRKACPVEVEIELRLKGGESTFTIDPVTRERKYTGETTEKYLELSICGAIKNHLGTKWLCGGQCLDTIAEHVHSPLFKEIYRFWKLYHLNGMHAGTEEQEAAIEAWKAQGNKYEYRKACEHLKSIGLYEVEYNGKPYRYGHAWLHREIPEADLARIQEIITNGQ